MLQQAYFCKCVWFKTLLDTDDVDRQIAQQMPQQCPSATVDFWKFNIFEKESFVVIISYLELFLFCLLQVWLMVAFCNVIAQPGDMGWLGKVLSKGHDENRK